MVSAQQWQQEISNAINAHQAGVVPLSPMLIQAALREGTNVNQAVRDVAVVMSLSQLALPDIFAEESPYRQENDLPTAQDIMTNPGAHIIQAPSFENSVQAKVYKKYVCAPLASAEVSNTTIPTSNTQKQALAHTLYKACMSTANALDNEAYIFKHFTKKNWPALLPETRCIELVDLLIERCRQSRDLRRAYNGKVNKSEENVKTFAQRFNEVLETLRSWKSRVNALFDAPVQAKLVDEGSGMQKRTATTQMGNLEKQNKLEAFKETRKGVGNERSGEASVEEQSEVRMWAVTETKPRDSTDGYVSPRKRRRTNIGRSKTAKVDKAVNENGTGQTVLDRSQLPSTSPTSSSADVLSTLTITSPSNRGSYNVVEYVDQTPRPTHRSPQRSTYPGPSSAPSVGLRNIRPSLPRNIQTGNGPQFNTASVTSLARPNPNIARTGSIGSGSRDSSGLATTQLQQLTSIDGVLASGSHTGHFVPPRNLPASLSTASMPTITTHSDYHPNTFDAHHPSFLSSSDTAVEQQTSIAA